MSNDSSNQADLITMNEIMLHTDKGHVALSRAGLAAFNKARDTGACAEYAIACYLEAARGAK